MARRIASYLKADMYRLLTSPNLWLSILGIQILLCVIPYSGFQYEVSVFYIVNAAFYGLPSILCYIFCAVPFACSFCEDFEFRYHYLMISRGGFREYVFSKIVTVLISSCLVMLGSTVLYAGMLSRFLPWITTSAGGDLTNVDFIKFGYLLQEGKHFTFYFLCGLEMGLLNGILSLLAAFFSICLPNKLLTLSIPVMGAYFIYTFGLMIGNDNPMMNLYCIFGFNYKVFSNDVLSFLYSVGISMVAYAIIGSAIFIKLKRRYYG